MAGASEEENVRVWDWAGCARRDCEPHRGSFLQVLATITLVCAILSFFPFIPILVAPPRGNAVELYSDIWLWILVPILVAVPLGSAVVCFSRADEKEMAKGRMDRGGRAQTLRASDIAVLGMAFCTASVVFLLGLFLQARLK
jgi:hypothetical protein